MKPLTQLAHELILQEISPGAEGRLAIDATAGNGHDTLFLAELVGPTGRVWAVDLQDAAITRTRERVGSLVDRVDLCVGNHADLKSMIPLEYHGQIAIVMFNLGYLPGGEKSMITQTDSTLTAFNSAWELLVGGGLLSVIAYPGHLGGEQEANAVADWISHRPLDVICSPSTSSPISPRHWLVRKSI